MKSNPKHIASIAPSSKFFEKKVPEHWMMAKQKSDVLEALTRITDLEGVSTEVIRPVGIINGAFDLLHASHLRLINEARWRAGTLVALLDSDEKVSRTKGHGRPIMAWGERAASLFYAGADLIVEIDSDQDFYDAIQELDPDFRVLGQEYQHQKSRLPQLHTVYTIDRGPHTTNIIQRIIKQCKPEL
jgi:D-beta-D-heptose 7-phosphate kinase/D-beta-D-heptose 1-phosphate adenosyltransferase